METIENLQSWQQAFEEYPISSTRAIEKQLRASIANDRGKLRGLVANNYQDLLASAEQIVLLEVQTRIAETHLSEIGQDCQPRQSQQHQARNSSQRRIVVELRLLQRCVSEIKTALHNFDVLQCSQLIAIARLLAKSLTEGKVQAAESLRNRVATLRRALLRTIDSRLTNPLTDPSDMVKSCCAYCLVTSSSSTDALKHIQRLRLDKLRSILSPDAITGHVIIEAVRYHLDGLQVLEGLTGRPLIDALGHLQKRPIFEDQSLRNNDLLDLRAIEMLLPEEIRTFVPYIKRTPLTSGEAQLMLVTSSNEACQAIAAGIQMYLAKIDLCSEILQLRRQLYMVFLPVYFSTAGRNELHEAFRTAFDDRIKTISGNLGRGLSEISLQLRDFDIRQDTVSSLWQPELAQMPLSSGGQKFLQQVRRRRLGGSAHELKSSKTIKAWISSVHSMRDELADLRKIRWRDHIEEPDDEQEDEASHIVDVHTQQDPASYIGHLQKALAAAITTYESTLSDAVTKLIGQQGNGLAAMNLLRAIRDSMVPLQNGFAAEHRFDKLQSAIPQLHGLIAAEVVSRLSQSTIPAMQSLSSDLDGLPSPRTFAFLRQLSALMLEFGSTDIWSPGAVGAVREAVASHIFHEERKKDFMQTAFDDGYLRIALQQPWAEAEALPNSPKKAVEEYWSRTKLLFGMVA